MWGRKIWVHTGYQRTIQVHRIKWNLQGHHTLIYSLPPPPNIHIHVHNSCDVTGNLLNISLNKNTFLVPLCLLILSPQLADQSLRSLTSEWIAGIKLLPWELTPLPFDMDKTNVHKRILWASPPPLPICSYYISELYDICAYKKEEERESRVSFVEAPNCFPSL